MKTTPILILLFLLLFCQGCNTLYMSRVIDIEVMEPAKVLIPDNYKNIAVRYNNSNVALHSTYQKSFINGDIFLDDTNLDSIASHVYFDQFLAQLKTQEHFDTIVRLNDGDLSKIQVVDTISFELTGDLDSLFLIEEQRQKLGIKLLSSSLQKHSNEIKGHKDTLYLIDRFGLYTKEDLEKIADSTQADMLISLDFFSSIDGINYYEVSSYAHETVGVTGLWNFYDLHQKTLKYFYKKEDTVNWNANVFYASQLDDLLPPTKDAVLNAADISGSGFANFLIPHWTPVQRMYYASGHVELKKTDEMVKNAEWFKAAEIWKANLTNPNQSIVAKCMFNLSLACEMNNNLDAAMDWVVQSYYILENKNEIHKSNCQQYIRILAQRKIDFRKLENQFAFTSH